MHTPSRRSVLRSIGIASAAIAVPPLLSSCSTSSSSGNATNRGVDLAPWPTYVPKATITPDLKGDGVTGIQDTYLKYPTKLTKGTSETPGDRSTLKVMTITYGTAPTPRGQNKYWQAMEKALGVKIDFTPVPAADFMAKMATLMAGDDLPDILNIGSGATLPHEAPFVLKTMANISEFVSGDAVKDYPNLANIPTDSWKAAGRFHGGIYGVPVPRARPGLALWINSTNFEKQGFRPDNSSYSREDFTRLLQELTHGRQYGIGAAKDNGLNWFGAHAQFHGVPNTWSVSDGKFNTYYESPHFKETLAYLHTLWKQRQYYPDSASTATVDLKTQFYNGTVQSYTDSFGALPTTLSQVRGFKATPMISYSANGVDSTPWAGPGYAGYTVINKKLSKPKIKMVLKVLDFLASPFGTEEYQLLMYGVEGVHFTYNKNGDPIPTALGKTENVVNLPFYSMCSAPQVLYVPNAQEEIKAAYEWQRQTCPKLINNPATGLRSNTLSTAGATLSQVMDDAIIGIITGRQAVNSWDSAVGKWKSEGGDKIAAEYESEYSAGTTK
ncbi:extracellular solute-binding protein [Streptomyces violaceusniger]|uniref:extracellular solute-binding protein n=1 Tax=Streptomyces violaceusniger TaxID=68280 RepID=UPI000996650F|nr:extracellular solute-binding protein [Streptomyces hygroscopicus]AQW56475.1 putative ABC transporter peptide-binding protein YtcQ [Streptomyces hygroscopicus]